MRLHLLLFLFPVVLVVSDAGAANNLSFLTPNTFKTGLYGVSNTVSVVAADFNGDGKVDLAVANQGTGFKHIRGFVAVLLGNGDGTFKAAVEYTAGGVPDFIAVGDFNNDGKIDLVTANDSSNNVSILLGNGDGTFQAHMDFGTVNAPQSLVVGDFNNDGRIDVAATDADVTHPITGNVGVLLGNGDGTLQPAISSPAGGYIQAIAGGDFNGDGILDLAVANKTKSGFPGSVTILLGNGDGTFKAPASLGRYSFTFVIAADFNQDGNLDLATDGGQVFLGRGDGTFASPITLAVSLGPMVSADLNGDGKLDLAVAKSEYISVLYGVGDGTFEVGPSYYGGGSDAVFVAVADFNNDHHPDLTVTNKVDANVGVLLAKSQASGQFRAAPDYTTAGQFSFADFNGDHLPDMAAISYVTYADYQLQVYQGNGDGTFQNPTNYSFPQSATWVVSGDFNNDGKVDVAVGVADVNCENPGIVIMLGNGNGTFGSPATYSAGGCTNFIGAADLNSDGKLDLITLSSVLLGNGDGTFQSPVSFDAGTQVTSFVVGDFNSDGKADLATMSYSSSTLSILIGNGDGTFQQAKQSNLGNVIYALAAADLNHDGKLDVVVTTESNSSVATLMVLLGNGDGTFRNQAHYQLSIEYGYGITVADLNRDGKLDVAVVGYGSTLDPTGDLLIFAGNGDGTLQNPVALSIGNPYSVATPDLNQDGVPDVVVLGAGANMLINTTK